MTLPEEIQFLAIEGVIGVGKSSLSEMIAQRLGAQLMHEEVEENPFLGKFYSNREAYAFQVQLFFLLSRHKQFYETFEQRDMFSSCIVGDYVFDKDRIFASINLTRDELAMYDKVAHALAKDVVKPDFVVYLQANIDTLVERIKKRGRTWEQKMDRAYLEELIEAYNHYFFHVVECPVLIVNTDNIDFVEKEDDLKDLLNVIESFPKGTTYYSPTSLHL
ncbi:MAG: deoxynucleoside kinase [Fibrobacterales bacterium]